MYNTVKYCTYRRVFFTFFKVEIIFPLLKELTNSKVHFYTFPVPNTEIKPGLFDAQPYRNEPLLKSANSSNAYRTLTIGFKIYTYRYEI